ncbi:MAG: hypothetical protein HC859_14810, partial [Bacteroidia bacterium]|nr:hypothetical protein [Bacteroidia bacterium]
MNTSVYSQFKLRVNINAPVAKVYNMWATQQGLESWFLRRALFAAGSGNKRADADAIQKGDAYEWTWHGYPDAVMEKGKVLQAQR